MAARTAVRRGPSKVAGLEDTVKRLGKLKVAIGIPFDGPPRKADAEGKTPPNNAVIGYVMEYGDDERNIPARPFLVPGVRAAAPQIIEILKKAGQDAFDKDFSVVKAHFKDAGIVGMRSVQQKMNDGPFAPLALSTIKGRARSTKRGTQGAKEYLKLRAQGTPDWALQDALLVKPLIFTGELRRSVVSLVYEGSRK